MLKGKDSMHIPKHGERDKGTLPRREVNHTHQKGMEGGHTAVSVSCILLVDSLQQFQFQA